MHTRQGTHARVVPLFGRPAPASYNAIALVEAYWDGLRDGRRMPRRAEVDPRGLQDALHYAFVAQQVAPGAGRIRIAGPHLTDLLGMAVQGLPLTALLTPAARPRLSRVLDQVHAEGRLAEMHLHGAAGPGQPELEARLWLAPLAGGAAQGGTQMLGCFESHGSIGRAPRRFDVTAVKTRRVVATAGSAAAAPAGESRGKAPHLTLVKG